jgi:phosphate transport system substrate-binding protein
MLLERLPRRRFVTPRSSRRFRSRLTLFIAAAIAAAWPALPQAQRTMLVGAGATFPYPLYSTWFVEYARRTSDVQFSYQSIGSGAGIRQLMDQFVFFGATDTPMTELELLAAPARIVHLPTVVGAVVPIYNVPGLSTDLRFSGPVLADIFLGRITNWNDPAIAQLNAGVPLPPVEISPVFRGESSGTSFVWSDYLSKVSPEWQRLVGANRASTLPVGLNAKGSEGVSALVKQTVGAIGYVELSYAIRNGHRVGLVRNSENEFVSASVESVTAAANAAIGMMPRDLRVSITNAPGRGVYPVTSFTWILMYERPGDRTRSRMLVDFLRWALDEGQQFAPGLGYAPLPREIADLARAMLARIKT